MTLYYIVSLAWRRQGSGEAVRGQRRKNERIKEKKKKASNEHDNMNC